MKNLAVLFLFLVFSPPLFSQAIEGNSNSSDTGVRGSSVDGIGVDGGSETGLGVFGFSHDGIAVQGKSNNGWGVWAESEYGKGIAAIARNNVGGLFYGGNGIAIELRGSDSPWGVGDDDGVIISDRLQTGSDIILVANDAIQFRLDDDNNTTGENFRIYNGADTPILTLDENGNLTISGSYFPTSDINRKEKITSIDPKIILEKIEKMPISEWQFKEESIRHIGPMAQDFYAAFGLGQGETTIATVDADGVALAAIQALKKENDELRQELAKQSRQFSEMQEQLAELKTTIQARANKIKH